MVDVEAALLDPAFLATSTFPLLDRPELVEERYDGHLVHRCVRYRFIGPMAPAIAGLLDARLLTWIDDATFDLDAHRSRHRVVPDFYGELLETEYMSTLDDESGSCRRELAGSVEVLVPVLADQAEQKLVDGFRAYAQAEAAMLERWIAERAAS